MRNDKLLKKILKNTHRTSFDFENEYIEMAFDEAIKIKNRKYDNEKHGNLEDSDEVKFYKFNPHDNGKLNVFIDFDNSRYKQVRMYIFDMDGLLISESGSEYNQALCNSIDVVDNNEYLIAVEAVKGRDIDYSLKVKNYTNYEDYMENVEDNDLGSKYEIDEDYKFWELDDKRNFKYGNSGIMVVELERALFKLGYINEELSQDGSFGETIKDALEEFKDDYKVSSKKGQVNDDVVDALEIAMLERRKIISIRDVELKEPQFRPHTYYKAFEVEVENSSEEYYVKDLKIIVEDEDGDLITTKKISKISDGEKEVYKAFVTRDDIPEDSAKTRFNIKIVSDDYEEIVFDEKEVEIELPDINFELIDALKDTLTGDLAEYTSNFMNECYKLVVETIGRFVNRAMGKGKKVSANEILEEIERSELQEFKKAGKKLIEEAAKNPLIKSAEKLTGKGVIGVMIDLATGGGISVGGAIGLFVDHTGRVSLLLTGSLGVGTTDIDVFPALMYYPTMSSLDKLLGVGVNFDIGYGPVAIDVVLGEECSIGIDILAFTGGSKELNISNTVSNYFKQIGLKMPDIDASLTIGYTKELYTNN